ncbi:MAG: proteasome accessory factor PafA2 family protein [Acidimicrobiales bacterium]
MPTCPTSSPSAPTSSRPRSGLETTLKRPIINTRDEPHADAQKYRRLHVITGDANCAEVATLLKVGTTALVLCLIEDEALPRTFSFRAPVATMREVSHDLTLRRPLELVDGTTVTALEVQWELLARARAWAEAEGLEAVGGSEVGELVLREWEAVLTDLEADPTAVATAPTAWPSTTCCAPTRTATASAGATRVAAMALQYHDLRPHRSLADRVGLRRLVSPEEVAAAMTEPPSDTRAYFRGRCLQRWSSDIVAANWDSIVFDIGQSTLRRVPMMEPLRGTRSHVGTVVDESADPAELLARLSG